MKTLVGISLASISVFLAYIFLVIPLTEFILGVAMGVSDSLK